MRYPEAHAAKSGSVPFALRGPKSVRRILATAVAGAIGLVPAVLISSPAMAAAGEFSIADASATEGQNVVFTITREGKLNNAASALPEVKLTWSTTDNTAMAPADYTAAAIDTANTTITFPSWDSTTPQRLTISVATKTDNTDEADDEDFTVTIAKAATEAGTPTFTDATAKGTIIDADNPTYTLSASPNPVSESLTDANRHARITATLTRAALNPVSIPVMTQNDTATAGQDYVPLNTSISIAQGQLTGYVDVEITDDDIDEPDIQSFKVNGGAATADVSGTSSVTVNIADNDDAPVLSIGSAGAVTEGQASNFTVSMVRRSEKDITFKLDTSDGPATNTHGAAMAGKDYTAVTGTTFTVPALGTSPSTPLSVMTLSDDVDEPAEDFTAMISGAMNATVGTAKATGVINDSGTTLGPQVQLSPSSVSEGDPDTPRSRTFTVKLTKASGRTQVVGYNVTAGSAGAMGSGIGVATADEDFVPTHGSLTFAPGETEKTFKVDVVGDWIDEDNGENIKVTLTDTNSSLSAGQALGDNQVTITDDDDKPKLTVKPTTITMDEGDGYSAVLYQVNLSNPSSHAVKWYIDEAANPGTANIYTPWLGMDDYTNITEFGVSHLQTIAAGTTTGYALLLVKGDDVYEPDETARFMIARDPADTAATGDPVTTTLTIKNDDPAPVLMIDNKEGAEGDTVKLTGVTQGAAQAATVLNVTLSGKATAKTGAASANDYTPPAFPVTIPAGTPSGSIIEIGDVQLVDDTAKEGPETIEVSGVGFNGTGSVKSGWVTIAASDGGTTPENPGGEEPGGEEPGEGTAPTLMAPASVRGTGPVTITGKADPGATVWLWGASIHDGEKELGQLASVKAGTTGAFSFSRMINQGMLFQVSANGMKSDIKWVRAQQNPVFVATSPSKGWLNLAVQGTPRGGGQSVTVQRWTGKGWVTAWTGMTSETTDQWRATVKQASGSKWTLRALIGSAPEWGITAGYSVNRMVTIK